MIINAAAQNTLTDYDGNIYPTVTIGTQVWMKENLRSAHYADGTLIANNCWYNNNLSTDTIYGRLYQWDAAMKNSHIQMAQGACPAGWHLPGDAEWIQLFNAVNDSNNCAFALKETDTLYWSQPLIASNTTGFSMVGGGGGYNCSFFDLMGTHAEFWTSTEINSTDAKNWSTNNQSASMFRHYNQDKANNFSVRCVNNSPAGINNPGGDFNQEFTAYTAEASLIISAIRKTGINFSYSLFTVDGKEILAGYFSDRTSINLSSLSKGIYFLSIKGTKKIYYKKILN